MKTIDTQEFKRHFLEYISRASNGERFIITGRSRPLAAMIGFGELQKLNMAGRIVRQLARAFGQSPSLLKRIEEGKVHPAMAAFGLWKDEEDLTNLDQQVHENRHSNSRASMDS